MRGTAGSMMLATPQSNHAALQAFQLQALRASRDLVLMAVARKGHALQPAAQGLRKEVGKT